MGISGPEMQQILPVTVAFLRCRLLIARTRETAAPRNAPICGDRKCYIWRRTTTIDELEVSVSNEEGKIVFDPRGVVETDPHKLSARVAGLNGLRLGVLDNTKWNAGRLLRKTAAKLQEGCAFAAVNYYKKESFSKEAAPALVETIAANNDIVLTAIGD